MGCVIFFVGRVIFCKWIIFLIILVIELKKRKIKWSKRYYILRGGVKLKEIKKCLEFLYIDEMFKKLIFEIFFIDERIRLYKELGFCNYNIE